MNPENNSEDASILPIAAYGLYRALRNRGIRIAAGILAGFSIISPNSEEPLEIPDSIKEAIELPAPIKEAVDWIFDREQSSPFTSTCLEYAIFKPRSHVLICGFTDRTEYEYYYVDKETYVNLVSASSVGNYFNWNVRDSFPYRKTI